MHKLVLLILVISERLLNKLNLIYNVFNAAMIIFYIGSEITNVFKPKNIRKCNTKGFSEYLSFPRQAQCIWNIP